MSTTTILASDWLLHSSVGGGLLLLVAWLLMRGSRQPAQQQTLGQWGVVAALLLAVLCLGPRWLTLPLLDPIPGPLPQHTASFPEGSLDLVEESLEEALAATEALDGAEVGIGPMVPGDSADDEAATAPAETARSAWLTTFGLLLGWLGPLYLVVAGLLLGRWLLGHVALAWLLRNAHPAPARVERLFRARARGTRPPRLLVSRRLHAPISCGVLRPTVVVPASLCAPGASVALRCVFAHELTHLERRDAWACLLLGLGQVVYFYVPWFWWVRRQVRLCQEYVADAAAVEEADSPEDYAEFLLSLARTPAVPLGATGVLGNSSDLYRRVTMLLQSPHPVQRGCPRWWSWAAAVGLLALGVAVSGVGLRAHATPLAAADEGLVLQPAGSGEVYFYKAQTGKDDTKEAPAKKGDKAISLPDVDEILKGLPADLDAEKRKKLREDILHAREQMKRALEEVQKARPAAEEVRKQVEGGQMRATVVRALASGGRLGVGVEVPGAVLAEQLDLPKNQGLVVQAVQPNSAAAKAGIKPNDILLQIDGKAVPSDAGALIKLLDDMKAGTPVDVTVLRKGKKETLHDLTLPEARAQARFAIAPVPGMQGFGQTYSMQPLMGFATSGRGVMTTTFRTDDRFTTRHQEGSLIITVTGTVANGKASISEIHVQDGAAPNRYGSLEKVPEQYRDKVKNLLEVSEKSGGKITIKPAPEQPSNKVPIRQRLELKVKPDGSQVEGKPVSPRTLEVEIKDANDGPAKGKVEVQLLQKVVKPDPGKKE